MATFSSEAHPYSYGSGKFNLTKNSRVVNAPRSIEDSLK